MKTLALTAVMAALSFSSAYASPVATEAKIHFVNHQGIRDWRADDSSTLYVQDSRRNWYRATMFGRCVDLPFAQTIGFETRGIDTFDRYATIRVRGERCAIRSVVRSEAPPSKTRSPEG